MGIAISEKLSFLRKKSGKTQKEVAVDLNIAPSALSSYEQGKSSPPLDLAVRIAQYYGASLDWLCDIKEQDEPYTRAKILRTFTELSENLPEIRVYTYYDNRTETVGGECVGYITSLMLYCGADDWLFKYFERYKKLYSLYKSGDIDFDVIEAWKEKKYNENNIPVELEPPSSLFPTFMHDEDLPF